MDRGASSHLLSWMLLPVSAVLVLSALSLSRQPYTGLVLRGDWVAAVVPGSPAQRAGLARGDRVVPYPTAGPGQLAQGPLAPAVPGQPLTLLRERGGDLREVQIVPAALPEGERRLMAVLLAVASGFVVLGGWVWSERRERLTRAFFLLCLAFACLLAPLPRFDSAAARAVYGALYSGVSLYLPALFVHFFALFPEPGQARGRLRSVTAIAYGVATILFAAVLVLMPLPFLGRWNTTLAIALLQGVAGLWFGVGVVAALVLFARSYLRTRSVDARRRLRVALIGTILGVGPLAVLVAFHNLSAGNPAGVERWAVILTLLVPASFAWATAVHRIFEFRVALRAGAVLLVLALACLVVYFAGEWLAAAWRADLGTGIAGGALAFLALTASVAGPAGSWMRTLGAHFIPDTGEISLAEWQAHHPAGRRGTAAEILAAACEAVAASLKLDGCLALEIEGGSPRLAARAGGIGAPTLAGGIGTPTLAGGFVTAASAVGGVTGLEEAPLVPADRSVLEAAGVSWLMPVAGPPPRAVLLLGRRLSGPWLGLGEIRELKRLCEHLEVLLENATLRQAATAHAVIDRELTRAGAIQAHLLPRRIPAYRSLDCAAAALSSEPVGGDYYDFVKGSDRAFMLAVGDAAGKGVPAALMQVWAQAGFRNQARMGARPGQVLAALNRQLVALDQPEAFVALLCARVDVRGGRLSFANAGLTPPMLRRHDGTTEELSRSGVLLGVTPDATYQDTFVELDAGDVVVLYTDGLTEARCGEEMFGIWRLKQVLDEHAHRRASEIVRELLAAAQAFADQPIDDMTVVVLKQLTQPVRVRRSARENALKWGTVTADSMG